MSLNRFETITIELLNDIANSLSGGGNYKVISGKIRQSYDSETGIYSAEYTEILNETEYAVSSESVGPGEIFLTVDGFDALVYDIRNVQLFSGPSLDPRNTLSAYTFYEGDPALYLNFFSHDVTTNLLNSNGLGTGFPLEGSSVGIAFELRLYLL